MTVLQKGLSKWCMAHKSQEPELLGFLVEYGATIPSRGTLGKALMSAFEARAEAKQCPIKDIVDFIFDSDDVDAVTGRIQIMT